MQQYRKKTVFQSPICMSSGVLNPIVFLCSLKLRNPYTDLVSKRNKVPSSLLYNFKRLFFFVGILIECM